MPDKQNVNILSMFLKKTQKMEREFYQNQKEFKRLAQLKKELEDLPKQRQCHRYRWTQTETTFDVEIPMQKACEDKDLYLVVEKDQMQVAIKTDEAFGAITVGGNMVSAYLLLPRVLSSSTYFQVVIRVSPKTRVSSS